MYGDDAWKASAVAAAIIGALALIGLASLIKWMFF